MSTLRVPSEPVQRAAAACLAPLVASEAFTPPLRHEIVRQLLASLVADTSTFGERRGAAFGIAGVVKGLRLRNHPSPPSPLPPPAMCTRLSWSLHSAERGWRTRIPGHRTSAKRVVKSAANVLDVSHGDGIRAWLQLLPLC